MRCRRVGANVSPMGGMLSLAMMLIKPALLSHHTLEHPRCHNAYELKEWG
jgi:hypothetical protein